MTNLTRWCRRSGALASIAALSVGAVIAVMPAQDATAALLRGIAVRVENSSHYKVESTATTSNRDEVVSKAVIKNGQNVVQARDGSFLHLEISCSKGPNDFPLAGNINIYNHAIGTPEVSFYGRSGPHLFLTEGQHVTVNRYGVKYYIERKHDDTYTTKDVKKTKSYIVRVEAC